MNEPPDTAAGQKIRREVVQTARIWNFDFYLAATLAPARCQDDLIALAAFVGELERIRHTVTEPALAQIRVQWWRDEIQRLVVDKTGFLSSDHPIGQALAQAIVRSKLSLDLLDGIAGAVSDQLGTGDMAAPLVLEDTWLAKRHAAPFDLAVRCVGSSAHSAIKSSGRAYGLLCVLRELSFNLATHLQGNSTLSAGEIAANATAAMADIRMVLAPVSRAERVPFLPLSAVPVYLARLRRDTQPDDLPPEPARLRRVLAMASAHWFGRW